MKRIFKIKYVLILLIATSISSCYVGRDYVKPEVNTDYLFRTDQLKDSTNWLAERQSMAEVSWRNMFTDTLLQNYIERALANNLDIRQAIKNIEIGEAYMRQSRAAFEPVANASLNYGLAHNSKSSPVRDVNQFYLGADISWEADIWGKIKDQNKAVKAAYLQTIEAHNAVKTRMIASIASIYYQLISVDEQMAVARKSISTRDSSYQTSKALMLGGQLTSVAVQQTEAQIYEAQNILLNLKNQSRILENTLCLLMSEPSHAIERSSIDNQAIQTPLTLGVPAQLLANRPDVRQAEYSLMEAFQMTNVSKTHFYPSLVLSASGGFNDTDIARWLTPGGFFAQIGGGLLQPLLNRRQIKTAYEVAQTIEEQAFLRYEQTLLLAGNEVSDALYEYETQTEAAALQQKQYEVLKLAAHQSQQLLTNGLANYLEVLSAQQNVLLTELNLAGTQYKRLAAIIRLYEALGGGWQ